MNCWIAFTLPKAAPGDVLAAGAVAKAVFPAGTIGAAGTVNVGWIVAAAGAGTTSVV